MSFYQIKKIFVKQFLKEYVKLNVFVHDDLSGPRRTGKIFHFKFEYQELDIQNPQENSNENMENKKAIVKQYLQYRRKICQKQTEQLYVT